MRNFLYVALLALVAFGCSQSADSNLGSEKQSVKTEARSTHANDGIVLTSNITCPKCGYTVEEQLPTEVCQIAYTCKKCKTTMHPKGDDCCVFCTYGDHKCPSKQ